MISISTKTGDAGESGLADGHRLPKADPIFEVLGTLDELNSWIGLVIATLQPQLLGQAVANQHSRLHTHGAKNSDVPKELTQIEFLYWIQETLFHIGAEIAHSSKTRLTKQQLERLEEYADALQRSLQEHWYTKFLLPGGTPAAAQLDIARTVCRRAERVLVSYHKSHELSPLILAFLNRLSDYLYILRCKLNLESQITEHPFELQSS